MFSRFVFSLWKVGAFLLIRFVSATGELSTLESLRIMVCGEVAVTRHLVRLQHRLSMC
jgi:hypothetical protein